MKWGVRRYQKRDGSLTKEGIKKYGNSNTRTIKKNTKFHNISLGDRNNDGVLYTSYKDLDNKLYRGEYANSLRDLFGSDNIFDNVYVAKKDINIASQKHKVDVFKKMFESDPKGVAKSLAESKVKTSFFRSVGKFIGLDTTGSLTKKYAKLKVNDLIESGSYDDFIKGLVIDTPARKVFFDKLMNSGFDAITDDNDLSSGMSEDPLIFFKGNKSLKQIEKIPITEKEIDDTMRSYNEEKTLSHFGVLGMKWGVRRYQDKNGDLTDKGQKRAIKDFNKFNKKGYKRYIKKYGRNSMNFDLESYNKSAEELNNKYKSDKKNRSVKKMSMEIDRLYKKNFAKKLLDFNANDKYQKRALELVEKFKLYEVDNSAKNYMDAINSYRDNVGIKHYYEELLHFGVPGMRWGHRKSREQVLKERAKMFRDKYYSTLKKTRGKKGLVSNIRRNLARDKMVKSDYLHKFHKKTKNYSLPRKIMTNIFGKNANTPRVDILNGKKSTGFLTTQDLLKTSIFTVGSAVAINSIAAYNMNKIKARE